MSLTVGSGRRRHRVVVEVFTRDECHLCEEAEVLVAKEARHARVRRIDVDTDDGLRERYGERVPVVVVDGREISEGPLQPGLVARTVRRAREGRWADWRRA